MSDAEVRAYFPNTIDMDLFRLMCGEEIGYGIGRTVYECTIRPDLIVKIETPSHSFQNQAEWRFWSNWQHDEDVSRWLAPCEAISPCGTVLLQRRTEPLPKIHYPKKLPRFLTDTKRANFGILDRRLVCHDYGMIVSEIEMKLTKVDWWA